MLMCLQDTYPIGRGDNSDLLIRKGQLIRDYNHTIDSEFNTFFSRSFWHINTHYYYKIHFKYIDISEYREQKLDMLGC